MNYSIIIFLLLICQNLLSQDEVEKPFPTGQKIQDEEIIVRKLNLPDTLFNIIYIKNTEEFGVKENDGNPDDTLSYWDRIKAFKNVCTKTDLENIVFKRRLTYEVPSISDRIGLYNLSKHIGEFLIAEIHFGFLGGGQYEVELEITRSVNRDKVYHVKRSVINWAGLKRPLLHTLFNDIYFWVVENNQTKEVLKL